MNKSEPSNRRLSVVGGGASSPLKERTDVLCIGAGPAGLTAGYLLSQRGVDVVVLESNPERVGGISRTETYKGFRFDIGGHRFFSKSARVEALWREILPVGFAERPRLSRIYYRGKLFHYPLKAFDALSKLGFLESILCVLSYAKARMFPHRNPRNFETWVSNQFGHRLFNIFFKTYTEKVWGMSCREISADWAAQRIKGLSLGVAIKNALLPKRKAIANGEQVKTLIESFRYPVQGPGMLWEMAARKIQDQRGTVALGKEVTALRYDAKAGEWEVTYRSADGACGKIFARHVISSAPMRDLVSHISPTPRSANRASGLRYRDFLVVALVVKDRKLFDDNWIYVHEAGVKVGRIQNFKSWSPEMVPDPTLNCYGLEYFCFEGDGLWAMPDADLIAMAKRELVQLKLAPSEDILDGAVIRQPKAYPVYDDQYEAIVKEVREELATAYPNLHLVGRNGMHKYNNQDHAMMTAMLVVENILAGRTVHDVWKVNEDAEYHESGTAGQSESISGLRAVPQRAAG